MANSVTEWLVETALKHGADRGPGIGGQLVREAIAAKKFTPHQLNLRELAIGCFGGLTWEARMKRYSSQAGWVQEATEAVDLSAFRSIIGTNVAAVMQDTYTESTSVVDQLVGTYDSSSDDPLNELTIPLPAIATDNGRDVAPGTDYPRTGFSPWYISAPRPDKYGLIAVLTMELVRANRTKQWLDAASEVARKVAIEEVKRKLRLVLGITNNYTRNGTTYNTYLTSGDRVNLVNDLNLANGPAELDRLDRLFGNMVHPATGEPMDIEANTILTVRGNLYSVKNAAGVTEIRTTEGDVTTLAGSPFTWSGPILYDKRAQSMLDAEGGLSTTEAATWMAMGDFQKAFLWREMEPFHTFEVGPNDESWPPAFFQDIVYGCKARFWGTGFVADPFRVVAGYNAD